MKTIILMIALFSFGMAFNQKKTETVEIKTSAKCGMCKDLLEETLNYTSGVKYAELDLETKVLKIKFRKDKLNKEKLIKIINETGYDADSSPANKKAYADLPNCCKKGTKCDD